jgi:hypothetical protein
VSPQPGSVGSGAFRTAAPPGFVVLACLLGCLALLAATVGDSSGDLAPLLSRALLAVVAVLSALAAEALWHGRPWVRRVVDLWAFGTPLAAAMLGGLLFGTGDTTPLVAGGVVAFITAIPCAGVAVYVHRAAPRTLPQPPHAGPRLHP